MGTVARLLAVSMLCLAPRLAADAPDEGAAALPAYVKLPAGAVVDSGSVVAERYGEASIWVKDADPEIFRGARVAFPIQLPEVADESAALVDAVKASLTGAGWTVAYDARQQNPPYASFRYQKGGKNSILGIWFFGRDDLRAELIEIAPFKSDFRLKPPAATPEKVGPTQDFPYLAPLPGSRLRSTEADEGALYVTLPGEEEKTLVEPRSVAKRYEPPAGMSNVQFANAYREALTAAGWQVLQILQGVSQSDALVEAHYAKNGRDIWAALHHGAGGLTIQVADAGADDWAAQLKKDCRLPLYGVNFDFNKSTLRPDSEAALGKAAQALRDNAALKVEVQGHTDNVGGDDYNLKLSDARARSVMAWLAAHGIDAARMAAKGYGRGQPVADNETAEGRAKNRRVELACVK